MSAKTLRKPTLETIGLSGVLSIFRDGRLPVTAAEAVDQVFGPDGERGSLVISGAGGIVGAGKTMQLASRLEAFSVPIVGLDFPGAPDGFGRQYPGLMRAFGKEGAERIASRVVRLAYDGRRLPESLRMFRPRFLLEAVPEVLEIKRAHYAVFREAFPGIEIRSVTSGFPSSELGVGIAHPAFPHEVNKVWEVVEPQPSAVTRLLWAIGLIPISVSDHWSFVLDVLFCGLMHASIRYAEETGMPYWKVDKYVRRLIGPNPFRAHDAIGAAGANYLTWSCLTHLGERYGPLFTPTEELENHRRTGQGWYPPGHFRPIVNWILDADGLEDLRTRIQGPLFQMATLLLHEDRAQPAQMNAIGELCAQFRQGILAQIRRVGPEAAIRTVESWQKLHPETARGPWFPDAFERIEGPEWQQLYVNAEHDGTVGVITIGREAYNGDVDRELNRAIDWLRREGIERVIVTGDFHLSTQMVGADTSEFFPALDREEAGFEIARSWSATARRLASDFKVSVGFVNGKRCLGGFLELMSHCRYVVAVDGADLGMPEVTLPVVPGMEGCHWTFRRADPASWPRLMQMLLGGRPVKAGDAVGWLIDHAAPMDEAISTAWRIASGGDHPFRERKLEPGALRGIPAEVSGLPEGDPSTEAARRAIAECIRSSCGTGIGEALDVQARHSARFMSSAACRNGRIGSEAARTLSS